MYNIVDLGNLHPEMMLHEIIYCPECIAEFIARCFPDNQQMIKRIDAWEMYKWFLHKIVKQPSKKQFFDAMHRDGWTDYRTKNTIYFLAPGAERPKRGRKPNQNSVKVLIAKIEKLETENKRLRELLNQ